MKKLIAYKSSIEKYVIASKFGGSAGDGLFEAYEHKYQNMALESLKFSKKLKGVSIITTKTEAKKCLDILMEQAQDKIVACDTQTIDLDPKKEAPVGNGRIICASVFAGPEFNFGNGPKLFIDNFGENSGLIDVLRPFWESQKHKKCWHNYGFDRHVFFNHGINVRGFGGDTMHMARLFDSSYGPKDYSLAKQTNLRKAEIVKRRDMYIFGAKRRLTDRLQFEKDEKLRKIFSEQLKNIADYEQNHLNSSLRKVKIQELFKRKKTLRTGQEGKSYEFPSILTLHTSPQYVSQWVKYSVLDSQTTFFLRQALQYLLSIQTSRIYDGISNMLQLYNKYWLPFGQLLTDMEREGFKIDIEKIEKMKEKAIRDSENKKNEFMVFIKSHIKDPNADLFNPSSARQMQQLLHAPFQIEKKATEQPEEEIEQEEQFDNYEDDILSNKQVNRKELTELPKIDVVSVRNEDQQRGNKVLKLSIEGLGIPPVKLTPSGLPSVDAQSLKKLAGNPKQGRYGKIYEHLSSVGQEELGRKLSEAIDLLVEYRNIQTLLKTFIQPLKDYIDKNSRIHCSININTQTGRLSARKPNLQNQPALEKDIYKIREAFCAEKGKKLIVADYGQLELRVLAHITNCKAMLTAFKQGGDFHSRTAMGMFPKIRKEVEEGKLLLEWDKSKGKAPVQLLKDKYASERRKAKTMNFSIAYGKTAHGFAQDWNCSIQQANQSLEAWFSDRVEVRNWQNERKLIAETKKHTQTLLGRYRYLYKYFDNPGKGKNSLRNMAFRRAINTPIQGGAADIVIAAMVKIHNNDRLRELGWKLLLQIHDELILQGPEESSKQALKIVKDLMEHPLDRPLLVALEVDAKIGNNWYECK